MNFHFPRNFKLILGSLIAAVVLFWAILSGIGSGQLLAQSQMVVQTSQNIGKSLQYFYQDQDRYPSATEFANQNVMLTYATGFPLPEYISKNCSESFVYKRLSLNVFELDFCLPVATNNYQAGWNKISGSPPAKVN